MQAPRGLTAAAVGLLLSVVAACGTGHPGTAAPAQRHPLPTSSWTPGDPSLTALARGTLAGGFVRGTFCVWLSGRGGRFPVVWPAGYHVRLHPVELLNAEGVVVARAGDQVTFGGGEGHVNPGQACMLDRRFAFYVMSNVTARRQ